MLYDPSARFGNSSNASSRKPKPGGIFIGKVVRTSGGVFVQIPQIAPKTVFGPCSCFGFIPTIGQRVLCGFLDNRFDDVVILGRETKSKIVDDIDAPVQPRDASNKSYVDQQIQTLKSYIDSNFD